MDVSKLIKKKNLWIFDDTFQKDCIGAFVKADDNYLTNAGKREAVFILSIEGNDYMIMPFKLDYLDFVEKYGTDTRTWEAKQFKLFKNSKGKYVIEGIEENVL